MPGDTSGKVLQLLWKYSQCIQFTYHFSKLGHDCIRKTQYLGWLLRARLPVFVSSSTPYGCVTLERVMPALSNSSTEKQQEDLLYDCWKDQVSWNGSFLKKSFLFHCWHILSILRVVFGYYTCSKKCKDVHSE